MRWILKRLANMPDKSLSHHRDYALLMTFCYTGYRADSVLQMRWRDFQPRSDGEGMVHQWAGKGGKEKRKNMPPRVWTAILAYLHADGRYHPGQLSPSDDMIIWQGIRRHGNVNLAIQRFISAGHAPEEAKILAKQQIEEQGKNKSIAQSTANDILRRHLRRYFAEEMHRDGMRRSDAREEAKRIAATYHLHSLRHTFANTLDQASDGDIRLVSEMLDHSSIETTRTYLESIRDPEDKTTALLEQAYGF